VVEMGRGEWVYNPRRPFLEREKDLEEIEKESMDMQDDFLQKEDTQNAQDAFFAAQTWNFKATFERYAEQEEFSTQKRASDLKVWHNDTLKWFEVGVRVAKPDPPIVHLPGDCWRVIMDFFVNVQITGMYNLDEDPPANVGTNGWFLELELAAQRFPSHLGYLILSGKLNWVRMNVRRLLAYWDPPTWEMFNSIWLHNQKTKLDMERRWLNQDVSQGMEKLRRGAKWGAKWTLWESATPLEEWVQPRPFIFHFPSVRDLRRPTHRLTYEPKEWKMIYGPYRAPIPNLRPPRR
jgi:hypothetical protein